MKVLCTLFVLLAVAFTASGQLLTNGDLEDTPTLLVSEIAQGWQRVPVGDAVCRGTVPDKSDTPDLTSLIGPEPAHGLNGNPYAGQTFMSGMYNDKGGDFIYHEGIQQTVHLIAGRKYKVGFMQSVVKQESCQDSSGFWGVYLDQHLIGESAPTFSSAHYSSNDFVWEARSFTFTATAATHTLKFLPSDDDPDSRSYFGMVNAVRMGIDSIYLLELPCSISLDLDDDVMLCPGATLVLSAQAPDATYLWHDGSTQATFQVSSPGVYSVVVSSENCIVRDSVRVQYKNLPPVSLGTDATLCLGDVHTLKPYKYVATYLWQDGSTQPSFSASETGTYWVEVTRAGCTDRSEVNLTFTDCETELQMPNIFSPNNDGVNDNFSPILARAIPAMRTEIFNRWGTRIFSSESLLLEWNGLLENGEPAPEGLYFYHISYQHMRGGTVSAKGWVTVVR